ncbi:MAG: hypothetical protein CVT88_06700 [Candidatus Altiarchaeales archaeon HGW-Altiarchaeales-1]|nr:MAG: hypothetical protein CVT88_06700 [Candidatus Altiarchaeales archaeon HGW-Altiarchaeales-1]
MIDLEGKNVLSIEVKESPVKPVFATLNKIPVAFKRVGRTNPKMDVNELRRIFLEGKEFLWDSMICEGATLDDIDWERVEWFKSLYRYLSGREILTDNKKLLENFKCLKNGAVNNSGILLFGKEPHKFFPNNRITVIRYPGDEVSDRYLDIMDFYGNLFDLIDKTNKYIREHIQIASVLIPGQIPREEISQYPLFAIRELIVNAVAHRDYSVVGSRIIIRLFKNRIEYNNPGGFPPGITPENIADMQCSRNPTIVDVMSKVRYIESIGDGINRVLNLVKNHPLKPELPLFMEVGNSVIVVLYGADMRKMEQDEYEKKLSERQKKIVEYLKENSRITRGICMNILNISKDTAVRELSYLKSKNIIGQKSIGRGIYYVLK